MFTQYYIYDSGYFSDKKSAIILAVCDEFLEAKEAADEFGDGTVVVAYEFENKGDVEPLDESIVYICQKNEHGAENPLEVFETQYPILAASFEYNHNFYNVALTPELCYEGDGLDFISGRYHCLAIISNRGTKVFEMIPDEHKRWETEPKGMDPGFIDKLDEIITAYRNGEYRTH